MNFELYLNSFLEAAEPEKSVMENTKKYLSYALKTKKIEEMTSALPLARSLDLSADPLGKKSPGLHLGFLRHCPNLSALNLSGQPLLGCESLTQMSLKSLVVQNAQAPLSDVKPLLNTLKELVWEGCALSESDRALLGELSLEKLTLKKCELRNLDFLKHLETLVYLDASQNHLTRFPPTHQGWQMQKLILDQNMISEIDFCKNLKQLLLLKCCDNGILSLEPVVYLSRLEEIDFRKNRVRDLREVKNLRLLRCGLSGNPIHEEDIDAFKRSVVIY